MNEQTIQTIAEAILANTKVLQSLVDSLPKEAAEKVAQVANVAPSAPVVQAITPVVEAPAPVATAPAMPPAPTFEAPVASATTAVPFSDGKGLIDYVMGAYKALGAEKGQQIQGVLTGMGYQNINDVKPEHYGQLFAGVEALKG